MPYDFVKDFAPVTFTGSASHMLVAHPSIPVKTVKDLIALAKARRGRLTFASSGIGNATHLTGELLSESGEAGEDKSGVRREGRGGGNPREIGRASKKWKQSRLSKTASADAAGTARPIREL